MKVDIGRDEQGQRKTTYRTVRGTRARAEEELARLLTAVHGGTYVETSSTTVGAYMLQWHAGAHQLGRKTAERFLQAINLLIVPHLGEIELQKLKPVHISNWHSTILKSGGKNSKPLKPSTVRHAHAVLRMALAHAVRVELVSRNVASGVKPPKVEKEEAECLKADQIAGVLQALDGHPLHMIVTLGLSTGCRRGELLALRWADVDLDAGMLTIERSLEQTKSGLNFKSPKTAFSRRTISLPQSAIEALRQHRKRQLELRLQLGQGKLPPDALIFCDVEGRPIPPSRITNGWRDAVRAHRLPRVSFHGLRHTHASCLIAAGLDVVTVSRRLGHASANITLDVYSHLFSKTDQSAATMIDAAMKGGKR